MDAYNILRYLQGKKNVLLMGAPGTGKSKLMNEVALAFENGAPVTDQPLHQPGAAIPIPAAPTNNGLGELPMLQRQNRKVFRTTLHQNTKYRDFLTGIIPRFDGTEGYQINEGILYRANEYAKRENSAALLIIDEINRGPAIEVFGGSIVAIEADKRLSGDNTPTANTQYFEITSPVTNSNEEYAFSPHLYILAAMNQADVSVAPLDVAFLRRWMSVMLYPDYQPIINRFGIDINVPIPEEPQSPNDVFLVATLALKAINKKIAVGRGPEYQLGQGVFLSTEPHGTTLADAKQFVLDCWFMIYAHIEELFFGEPNSMAYILNAEKDSSPYSLEEITFAGDTKFVLSNSSIDCETIYRLYRSLLEDN